MITLPLRDQQIVFVRHNAQNEDEIGVEILLFFLFESPFICKLYKYIQQMV
jgi:hypothetical protein